MAKGDFHRNLAQKKRSQICDAAIELFLRQGFEITTMNEISAKANVSIMTLYKNFKSKDDLFKFVINNLFDRVSSALKMSANLEMDAKSALSLFLNNYCRALIEPSTIELTRLLISNTHKYPDIAKEYVDGISFVILNALSEYINILIERNILRPHRTSDSAGQLLAYIEHSFFLPRLLYFQSYENLNPKEEVVREIIEIGVDTVLSAYRRSPEI